MDNISDQTRYFFDLGSSQGQSLGLYSEISDNTAKETIVFCIEASNNPSKINKLKANIKALRKKFKSIIFINSAASASNKPTFYLDDLETGRTAIKPNYCKNDLKLISIETIKNLIRILIPFSRRRGSKYFISGKRYVSSVNILDLIPFTYERNKIDMKVDLKGGEYSIIKSLHTSFKQKIFNRLFLEIYGHQAGFTYLQDRQLLYSARSLSEETLNWDTNPQGKLRISPITLSDLIFQRMIHYKKHRFLNAKPERILFLLINKTLKLPIIRYFLYTDIVKAYDYLKISKALRNSYPSSKVNKQTLSRTPERSLILQNLSLNLKDKFDTHEFYKELSQQVQEHFFNPATPKRDNFEYKIATKGNNKLLHSSSIQQYDKEIYRFIVNPLEKFPAIIDLLTSSVFRDAFEGKNENIRIAGVNLRLSSPSDSEAHTTAFHRDYNSYYTVKIFIPLSQINYPFLEYIPGTELINTSIPHYTPKHIKEDDLPKKIKKLDKGFSSVNISNINFIPSSCIHRELPSDERKITLIITYLSHPDFGFNQLQMRRKDLIKNIKDRWSEEHLSFIRPT